MVKIKSFRAFRPKAEFAERVAAPPYDVVEYNEAKSLTESEPFSFLHIDRAEVDMDESISSYDSRVYQKASENLSSLIQENILIQEERPVFYIYSLTMNDRTQVGLVACTSVDDYIQGKIKKHELTRHEKEMDRIRHIEACQAHTGPIFMMYQSQQIIDTILTQWMYTKSPLYRFTSEEEVLHEVWVIDDQEVIHTLMELFQKVPALYIADGHHRAAAAVKVALNKRDEVNRFTGEEEYNFFLSVLFPTNQLQILDYNRVIRSLNELSVDEFMKAVGENFFIEMVPEPFKPERKREFGMYIEHLWYKLSLKDEKRVGVTKTEALDVSILQDFIFEPILGITDVRHDERIDFIGGIKGLTGLQREVDNKKAVVAFSLYPTAIDELVEIADANLLMPPKSTWFEPKLKSGLFIHLF